MGPLKKISRVMFLVGALALIAVSCMRFTMVRVQTVHQAILNVYYLFLGVLVGLSQLNFVCLRRRFRFMFYHWGKAFFCIFLSSMTISNTGDPYAQYTLAVYFAVCSACFFILATCCDR